MRFVCVFFGARCLFLFRFFVVVLFLVLLLCGFCLFVAIVLFVLLLFCVVFQLSTMFFVIHGCVRFCFCCVCVVCVKCGLCLRFVELFCFS